VFSLNKILVYGRIKGTSFARKTWELSDLAEELDARFLSEFPEDLGKTDTGVPASLWQMQEFMKNLAKKNMKTFALFQCEFGAKTPKPTRFLSDLDHFKGSIYEGVPEFDREWKYKGPLPGGCPHPGQHDTLTGTDHEGKWKTAPAAQYPRQLCAFLAEAILFTFTSHGWTPLLLRRGMELQRLWLHQGRQLVGLQVSRRRVLI
jgi:hypothetical protein